MPRTLRMKEFWEAGKDVEAGGGEKRGVRLRCQSMEHHACRLRIPRPPSRCFLHGYLRVYRAFLGDRWAGIDLDVLFILETKRALEVMREV